MSDDLKLVLSICSTFLLIGVIVVGGIVLNTKLFVDAGYEQQVTNSYNGIIWVKKSTEKESK